jgi:hypothetical protein
MDAPNDGRVDDGTLGGPNSSYTEQGIDLVIDFHDVIYLGE